MGEEVDHIKRLTLYPPGAEREAARFDHRNVQTLCSPCHRRKTQEEALEVRRLRRAQERTGQLW